MKYNDRNGPKLRLVHPASDVKDFDFMGATGAIQVRLASFGRF